MPLNSLRQDKHTPEEDEENDEIILIDSIWEEEYSEVERIEVTEQITTDNRNILHDEKKRYLFTKIFFIISQRKS